MGRSLGDHQQLPIAVCRLYDTSGVFLERLTGTLKCFENMKCCQKL